MFSNYQRTIKNSVHCFGIGLHSGKNISMTLLPAPVDRGIVFRRVDIKDGTIRNEIEANYSLVSNTMLGTTLTNNAGLKVATVEHFMAALWGCGIDNIIIELDGGELPIMDGSSEPFVFMLECAGVEEQPKPRKVIEVTKKVEVSEGQAYMSVTPAEEFSVSMEIEFSGTAIDKQNYIFNSKDFSFKMDLCRARTFGFVHEVEKLRQMGLALGGSLENAIVIDGGQILNKDGLRYKDEFVRHKILDSIGDFYLAGAYIKGHFHGVRSGHALNNKLLRAVFADSEAWRVDQ